MKFAKSSFQNFSENFWKNFFKNYCKNFSWSSSKDSFRSTSKNSSWRFCENYSRVLQKISLGIPPRITLRVLLENHPEDPLGLLRVFLENYSCSSSVISSRSYSLNLVLIGELVQEFLQRIHASISAAIPVGVLPRMRLEIPIFIRIRIYSLI